MVRWMQNIFGIQMYHEEMQVKFNYGCDPIIIGEFIALGLRKLIANEVSINFIDGWMNAKDIWYTDVSLRDAGQVQIWMRADYYWRSHCPWT
jgi:hypothetical protein